VGDPGMKTLIIKIVLCGILFIGSALLMKKTFSMGLIMVMAAFVMGFIILDSR